MLTNLPSQVGQEIEFIGPIVKERFAMMEEYGEEWNDKPVCHIISISGVYLISGPIHRTICSCG